MIKYLLSNQDLFFRGLFSSGLIEEQTAKLRLTEISKETLMVVLEYIYTGKAKFDYEDAPRILSLADYFQIFPLKNLCCYYLNVCYQQILYF